ncbi:biopolymer transporter Tol [Arthrospiribacter ruber]|uniref:biopolymer transporter Tol n=1 Tax=Arthrospiribacter ruber TaxID=2487934 RepID=UPI001FEB7A91|nr:biopolymer transporter Tol [Arthrospiribacter ruber]
MKSRIYLIIGFLILAMGQVFGQFERERFGKNRVQHKNIEWYHYTSNNFEVYYYDGGINNARMAIDFLEAEFDRLTQMIGYVAYTKPKIFIYNSKDEIRQSNLNLNKDEFTIDGQTFFSRLLGEVAFPGNWDQFKEDLIYTTSRVIIEEMLYGSTIADAFQSNLINSFPEWYIDGAARYLAYGWSREMDDYVRHYFKNNKNIKIHRLKGIEASLMGQSIWNFIVEKYGRRYVSSILNLSRINRNEENSIANTIGLNYKSFTEQWRLFYESTSEPVFTTFKDVNFSNEIASTVPSHFGVITDIKFSPDSKHLAYVINNGGKYKVQIREMSSGTERTLFSGGSRTNDLPVNTVGPVIAWRDTLNLALATNRRGTTALRVRAIDGSFQDRIFLRNITQILSLDFNSTGRNMVLSAIANGKSDVFTLNTRGQGRRLTNDVFDNLHPVFLNDSTVIYSSNFTEIADTLLTRTPDVNLLPNYFNLFKVDLLDSLKTTKLTNLNTRNVKPRVLNSNNVLMISDQSGINNLMRLTISNGIASQVSAWNRSIEVFDYSSTTNRIAFAVRDGSQSRLIIESFSNADQFTPSTPRVQLTQAKNLSERISTRRAEQPTQTQAEPESVESQAEAIEQLRMRRPLRTPATATEEGQEEVESEEQLEELLSEEELEELSTESELQEEIEGQEERLEQLAGESQELARDTTVQIRLEDLMLGIPPASAPAPRTQQPTSPSPAPSPRLPEQESVQDTVPQPQSLTGSINIERLRFERRAGVDTDNYTFDTIPVVSPQPQQTGRTQGVLGTRSNLLENFRRQSAQKRVTGPRRMTPQFITTSLSNDWVVDPLRGFGLSLSGKMTDLLDNHSFQGGLMFPLDFRSGSDIFFEYEYLKQRIDARFRFDRRAIVFTSPDLNQRYVLNKAELGLSYPLNVHSRITVAPFIARTQFFNLNADSIIRGVIPEQNRLDVQYAGGRAEFVIDKTDQLGLFMQQGFKGKVGYAHFQGLNRGDRSFSNFYLDVRNYQKIHKNIILASRLYAGSFFGNNPQNYLVGGMDNWLFNQFYSPPANRPEESPVRNPNAVENSNILFAEFVDLRGYSFDEIRGRNVMTFTTELRIPLFSYLSRGNITSNFIKNFQLVGFYDIGSAWNDAAPWERVNDQNTEVITTPGSPFTITINNFNNPWLQSYGAGLRTVLLNYYFKFDLAQPVRNYTREDLRFYVTLGYNF